MANSNAKYINLLSFSIVTMAIFNIVFFAGLYLFGAMLMNSHADNLAGAAKMLALISFWAIGNYGFGLIIASEFRAKNDS